jgi:hypothetical protein
MKDLLKAAAVASSMSIGAALLTGALVAPASAGAPAGGCPSGFSPVPVAELEAAGYQVPGQVDRPDSGYTSFGLPGNGDGQVCARQLGNQVGPYGPIYDFIDNQLPSRRA